MDLPMLAEVDIAIAVQKRDGSYDHALTSAVPSLRRAPAPGPAGWAAAVLDRVRTEN
jgi:hypothetical protein